MTATLTYCHVLQFRSEYTRWICVRCVLHVPSVGTYIQQQLAPQLAAAEHQSLWHHHSQQSSSSFLSAQQSQQQSSSREHSIIISEQHQLSKYLPSSSAAAAAAVPSTVVLKWHFYLPTLPTYCLGSLVHT